MTSPAASARASSAALTHVTYGASPIVGEAGVFIAKERGYFQQQGLDVEIVSPVRLTDMTAQLATAKLDFGALTPIAGTFNAMARGIDIQFVAPQEVIPQQARDAGLSVRQDLLDSGAFKGPQDLRGKTIAWTGPGTTSELYLFRYLANGGLTFSDVTLQVMSTPDMVAALGNKKVEAAWSPEPTPTLMAAQHVGTMVVSLGQLFPDAPAFFVAASGDTIKNHPDTVNRFVTAHLKAQRDYYTAINQNGAGRDQIVDILIKYTAIKDRSLYERMGMPFVDPNDNIDRRLLQQYQDFFLKQGEQTQAVDLAAKIDQAAIDYALKQLGRV
ncbi:MAG TPA: ABC transporter substrate-binding protein [Chloroflexota bacterium]